MQEGLQHISEGSSRRTWWGTGIPGQLLVAADKWHLLRDQACCTSQHAPSHSTPHCATQRHTHAPGPTRTCCVTRCATYSRVSSGSSPSQVSITSHLLTTKKRRLQIVMRQGARWVRGDSRRVGLGQGAGMRQETTVGGRLLLGGWEEEVGMSCAKGCSKHVTVQGRWGNPPKRAALVYRASSMAPNPDACDLPINHAPVC